MAVVEIQAHFKSSFFYFVTLCFVSVTDQVEKVLESAGIIMFSWYTLDCIDIFWHAKSKMADSLRLSSDFKFRIQKGFVVRLLVLDCSVKF